MPDYSQKITFSKRFLIKAKDADEATRKLESAIDKVEFASDLSHDGYYPFEDEEPDLVEKEESDED
jgi:hypothetical protein